MSKLSHLYRVNDRACQLRLARLTTASVTDIHNGPQSVNQSCYRIMKSNGAIFSLLLTLSSCVPANANTNSYNVNANKPKYGENKLKITQEYESFQAQVAGTITSILRNLEQGESYPAEEKGGNANGVHSKPAPVSLEGFEDDVHSLLDRVENMNAVLFALLPAETTLLEHEESEADVPDPFAWSKLNESVHLSCHSEGQPLRLCYWMQKRLDGGSRLVHVEDDSNQNGSETVFPQGFAGGKCVMKIQRFVEESDAGPWFCKLISQNRCTFAGVVVLDTYLDDFDSDAVDEHIRETSDEVQSVSRSNFAFLTTLLEELPTSKNLVFSPFTLGTILFMARLGADGQTATQIRKALRLPESKGNLDELVPAQQGFFKILKKIGEPSKDYSITMANGMFTQAGFKANRTFTFLARNTLNLAVTPLNFTDGLSASQSINSWLRDRTNGKFDHVFSPDSFSTRTKIVLVNAIYFKSRWKFPFEVDGFIADHKWIKVDMMMLEERFPYGHLQGLNATVVSVPYKGNRFSMHVIIPKRTFGLKRMLKALKNMTMNSIKDNIRQPGNCETVKLHLPKFKIESKLDLVPPLCKIGVTDMFSEELADLSRIPEEVTMAPKLFVSNIIQRVYIAVDEEGTDAAASTEPEIQAGVTCFPTG